METKANFVLIGAVTVLGMLGMLGLLIWFSKIQIDQQYTVYETAFESVSGLGMAADVRYNGLSVGQVIGLELDPDNPSQVRVRLEVDAETPVKTDTVAQLNSQGVTGVAFVALTGGSPSAQLLVAVADPDEIPEIPSERSVVQALTEDAPDLVAEAMEMLRELRTFLGPENQVAVSDLLQNLASASEQLDQALADFSEISRTVSEGTSEISRFTGRLDEIGEAVQTSLVKVNDTLDVVTAAVGEVEPTMQSATSAFNAAEATILSVDTFVQTRVPEIADDLTNAISAIETATDELRPQIESVLTKFGGSADVATQRLTELEATLAAVDAAMADAQTSLASVESASDYFEELMAGEGAALIDDARSTLAAMQNTLSDVDTIFQNDVPTIMADIRGSVATATEVIDQVSADVTTFTQRLDPLVDSGDAALNAATETLRSANRSLANLDRTLGTADAALDAAERTFSGADAVITTDLGPAIADVRSAAGQFEMTMATLSEDIPDVIADLREAAARALNVVQQIDDTVATATPPIRSFAQTGLPEFTAFARQAQQLVSELEKLTRKMERDPARFFFGNNIPEFGR